MKISNLKSNISNLSSNISNLTSQISNLKSNISNLKSKTLLTLLIIHCSLFIVKSQTFETAYRFGSENSTEEITDMKQDAEGNFFITGTYTGTVNFGGTILTSAGGKDVFILKTDADNNIVWATSGGGTGSEECNSIVVDNIGNCYIGGIFEGTAQFGSFSSTSYGLLDIFVAKINSEGNIEWFKHGGSNSNNHNSDKCKYIGINQNNSTIILIGYSTSNSNFDAFYISTSSYETLTKFNITNGDVISHNNTEISKWSNSYSINKNNELIISSKAYLADTQVISIKRFSLEGSLEKDIASDTTYFSEDKYFIQKINSFGYPFIYLISSFYENLTWGSYSVLSSSEVETDLFLTKINMEEDSVYWMKRIGGNHDERVYSIDTDQDKNLYITGYYENTCDFGSGVQLVSQDRSGFVAKYDSLGNVQWAKSVGSGTGDVVNSISVDNANGDAYVAGRFLGTANFDDIPLTSEGSSDLFFAKLGCSPAKPSEITGDTLLCVGEFDYSVINTPSVSYTWQVSGGGTITGSSTTNATSINWHTPGTYNLSVNSSNVCGNGIPRSIQVRVKDLPEDLTLSGDTLACLGTEAYNVNLEEETSYNWTINGGGMIFGIENTAVVNWTTAGTYNMSITPTNMCGDGNMLSQDIYVSTTPEQPAEISGDNEVCTGTENYGVPANSTVDYNWTLSSGGNLSFTDNNAAVNWDASGIHTLTVTATNRCGVGIPRALNVNVSDVPSQISAISGDRSVCTGTEEYSVLQESGVTYDWTLSGGGLLTENGNSAEIYWTTPGTYTLGVRPTNQCGTGTIKNISIIVNDAPLQPSAIIGVDAVCKGIQTYQTPLTEGVNYNWTLSGGGVLTPNNNTAEVDWDTEGTHTLTVVPYNLCGTGASKSLNVEVSASDAQISGINGNDNVCLATENYSADYVGGLTYNWQLATGGTINSNSTNNTSINWTATGYHTLILETSDGCSQSLVVKVDDVPAQSSEISGDNPVCLGESGYFVNNVQNTTYNWTISEGATLIPSANTVSADWTETGIHTLSVTPSNHCGSGTARTLNVDVKTIPAQASEILAEDTACLETTTYTINAVADITYNWDLENPGGVLIPNNNTADVVWLYPHENTISVSLSNLCGTSALQNKQIVVDDTPELPEIDGVTEVCLGEEVYTTTLENGHNYLWSINGGGTLTVENDTAKINWTQTGNHILSLTNSNRCGASETKSIIIKVNDIPAQPEAISGNYEVCYGIETYEITAIDGINYSWNLDGGGTISELNNSATINWTETGTYNLSITPSNMCGTGTASTKIINVHTVPAQTEEISGNDEVCLGNEVYSVNNTANTTYNWTLSNGGNISPASNLATIDWTDKGLYTLSVVPSNFCGSGISRTKIINVNDIPEPAVFNNPETTVCMGSINYAVNEISGATYDWQLSGGGTLTSNTTENTASVNWSETGTYQLSVTSGNECGNANTTSINIEVNDVPAQVNEINGEDNVCLVNEIYTTESISGVNYNWSLNGGGNITPSGNSVFVSWLNQGTYELSVTPYNSCGSGTAKILQISVNDIPNQPSIISGNDNACINTDEIYSVTNIPDLTYHWLVNSGGTVAETGNSANISWLQSGSHTVSVQAENICGTGAIRNFTVSVSVPPNQLSFLSGEAETCLGVQNYTVNEVFGVNYDWTLSGGGNITENGNSAIIDWQQTGNYEISVSANNQCGSGLSANMDVSVEQIPELPTEISGNTLVCLGEETYTTNFVNGTNYIWNLSGGGSLFNTDNTAIIHWQNKGNYTLSVQANNRCGTSSLQTLNIETNKIPDNLLSINGETELCKGAYETYFTEDVSDITYLWELNETLLNVDNDTINIDWNEAGNNLLSVRPENFCGKGYVADIQIKVSDTLPKISENITGDTVCCFNSSLYYAVDDNNEDMNYFWSVFPNAEFNQTLNSILTDWTNSGEYMLSVYGKNNCGVSDTSFLKIRVENEPETPQIEFRNDTLFSSSEFGNQWFKDGFAINDAIQNFYIPKDMGDYNVQIKNTCSTSLFSKNIYFVSKNSLPYGINIYPVPVKNNELTVEFPINLKWDKIEIISPTGKLMQEFIFDGSQKPILKLKSNLRKDIYLIKIYTEKGVILEKILIL